MNLNFSRRTDLALAALNALARTRGRKLSRHDLADRIGTTPSFLAQLMPAMVQAGWVRSERGPGGGYRLAPAAEGATLIELFEVMEGPTEDGRCVLRNGPCPGSNCEVHEVWSEARQVLVDGLKGVHVLQGEKE